MTEILTALIPALATVAAVLITDRRAFRAFRQGQEELLRVTLRTNIQCIYALYRGARRMPPDVYEGMCALYDRYVALGGNSYITAMKREMDAFDKLASGRPAD